MQSHSNMFLYENMKLAELYKKTGGVVCCALLWYGLLFCAVGSFLVYSSTTTGRASIADGSVVNVEGIVSWIAGNKKEFCIGSN